MIPEIDARQLSEKLTSATDRVARDYLEEDVVDEESFSGQLCGRLKETLESYHTEHFIWQVQTATDDGGHGKLKGRSLGKIKEEPLHGADLIVVIEAHSPKMEMKKGFLAQAKRLEPGKNMKTSDYSDLRDQCARMLDLSAASFVFLYSVQGVYVVSGAAVVASRQQDLWSAPTWNMATLYYDFAICWVGDTRLRTTSLRTLDDLRETVDAHAAVKILGKADLPDLVPRRSRRSVNDI